MKKNSLIVFVVTVILFVSIIPLKANAYTYTGAPISDDYWLWDYDTKEYDLHLPIKSKVTFDFTFHGNYDGDDLNYNDAWGDYKLTVIDDSGTLIYEISNSYYQNKDFVAVTELKEGDYTVIVQENSGTSVNYCILVTWTPSEPVPMQSFNINETSLALKTFETYYLEPIIEPYYCDRDSLSIEWTSSNPMVASVQYGEITARKPGTAIITAQCDNFVQSCEVTVQNIAVKTFKLHKSKLALAVGSYYVFDPTILPEDATNKKITWTSSNPKVAKVSSSGIVNGYKLGTSTVTAKCDGITKKCTINVNKVILERWTGSKTNLTQKVKHLKGFRLAKWSSSNSNIVTVDKKGVIKTKKKGKAKIYCKINGKKYTFQIYSYSKKDFKKQTLKDFEKHMKNKKTYKIRSIKFPEVGEMVINYSVKNKAGKYTKKSFKGSLHEGYYFSH